MSDFAVKLDEARARLPMRRLMEQHGKGAPNGNWRKFPCPYCNKSGHFAGVIDSSRGGGIFKCFHSSCPSGTAVKAFDEIGFLAHELNLSRSDASITYLKEAGVWKEREAYSPSVMPGKAARKNRLPTENSPAPIANSQENSAPAPVPAIDHAPGRQEAEGYSDLAQEGTEANGETPEAIPAAGAVNLPPAGEPTSKPTEMKSHAGGTHGSAEDSPASADQQCGGETPVSPAADAPVTPAVAASSLPALPITQTQVGAATGEVASKEGSLAETPGAPATSKSENRDPKSEGNPKPETRNPKPEVTEPDGRRALKAFYDRLTLSEQDEAELFHKRGLDADTSKLAGLKSNPRSNKEILIELELEFGWEEMSRAGLWVEADKKREKERRPNWQFCGGGIVRKAKDGERAGKDQWIMTDRDGRRNICGWTLPILIPYFDSKGNLCGLRPHKGGGQKGTLTGTPQPYIPLRDRQVGPLRTVVITEGEFKAIALLQTVGVLCKLAEEPVGAASLPGITFARHYELREMLDDWLEEVGCKRVIVAFDNEEHGDPKLDSFKADREKRFEAQKWARVLATDIYRRAHVKGMVLTLPNEWRNQKGKADWDGALAEIIKTKA
jgi:hypothetical protein